MSAPSTLPTNAREYSPPATRIPPVSLVRTIKPPERSADVVSTLQDALTMEGDTCPSQSDHHERGTNQKWTTSTNTVYKTGSDELWNMHIIISVAGRIGQDTRRSAHHKQCDYSRGNQTRSSRVLQTKETENGARIIEKSVKTRQVNISTLCSSEWSEELDSPSQLTKRLDDRDRNNGSSVWLVRPISGNPLFQSQGALKLCGCICVLFTDLKLEIDNIRRSALVYELKYIPCSINVVSKDEYSWWLWQPVK